VCVCVCMCVYVCVMCVCERDCVFECERTDPGGEVD